MCDLFARALKAGHPDTPAFRKAYARCPITCNEALRLRDVHLTGLNESPKELWDYAGRVCRQEKRKAKEEEERRREKAPMAAEEEARRRSGEAVLAVLEAFQLT